MLAPADRDRCLECTRVFGSDDFEYHYGMIENGPAYWSDRGILCSAACSLKHFRKRMAEGTMPTEPMDNPQDAGFVRR